MKKIFNSNLLKIIAISSMLLDHIAYLFLSVNSVLYFIFRLIGRVCAPIMFYGIANGYYYTKNKFKYGLRLFIFALVSQIPYSLFMDNVVVSFTNYNVIFTLFLAFLCLVIFDNVKDKLSKFSLIALCTILSYFCDWGIIGIVFTFVFYLLRNNSYKYVAYSICSLVYLVINSLVYQSLASLLIGLGLFLVIPLIYLDNGSKGKHYYKYLFYGFYPIHLIILYVIKMII